MTNLQNTVSCLVQQLLRFRDADFDACRERMTEDEACAIAALLIKDVALTLRGHEISPYLCSVRQETIQPPGLRHF